MSKPNETFDAYLSEWREKLAWAPYARAAGMDELDAPDALPYEAVIDWAEVEGTDEWERAQLDKACEDEDANES